MIRKHFEVGETAVNIICDRMDGLRAAEMSIFASRDEIHRFIRNDPLFEITLEPYDPPSSAPPLIKRMCSTSGKAGVGPMATVAGAIAEEAVYAMRREGCKQAVVDNGGDIALSISEPVNIAIYAGDGLKDLGLICSPRNEVYGICTSSSTIGPSISFGMTDAATVVSGNVALADACATRLGNLVRSDDEAMMRSALEDVCAR